MRILIIGHTGQDGILLRESVEKRGDEVFGASRAGIHPPDYSGSAGRWDVRDPALVRDMIIAMRPDEIYYLAAYHTSSEGAQTVSAIDAYRLSHETHVLGLLHVLAAVADHAPKCRVFYAASSLIFSGEGSEVQNEGTPYDPGSFYGYTKVQGIWMCREFRRTRNVYASVGILYNHESPYRAAHFLTQKIVRTAARIAAGSSEKLRLGDLSARVDWGYAGDYVAAFQKILALPESGEFIVATGEAHSVKEFAELTFDRLGLDWQEHTEEDSGVLTRRQSVRIGDSGRLRSASGWKPALSFESLIEHLVDAEKLRVESLSRG